MAEVTINISTLAKPTGLYVGAPNRIGPDFPDVDAGAGINRELGFTKNHSVGEKRANFLFDVIDLGTVASRINFDTFQKELQFDVPEGNVLEGVLWQVKANNNSAFNVRSEPLRTTAQVQALGFTPNAQFIHIAAEVFLDSASLIGSSNNFAVESGALDVEVDLVGAIATINISLFALPPGSYVSAPNFIGTDLPDTDSGLDLNRQLGYTKPGSGEKRGNFLCEKVDLGAQGTVQWFTFLREVNLDVSEDAFRGVLFHVAANNDSGFDVRTTPLRTLAQVQALPSDFDVQFIHMAIEIFYDANSLFAGAWEFESAAVNTVFGGAGNSGNSLDTSSWPECHMHI